MIVVCEKTHGWPYYTVTAVVFRVSAMWQTNIKDSYIDLMTVGGE